jgi:EmrB/QacA subfamily drug resistance transporter
MVGAQAIMGDVVSPRQRGRYAGYFGAVIAAMTVVGPLLGGFFTQHATWRWVFYINIPIGIVALFVIGSVLHLPAKRNEHSLDYLGTALLGAAVTAVILLTTWGGTTYPWASAEIIGTAIIAAALLVAFYFVEKKADEPLMPPSLFRNSVFRVTSVVGFIVGFLMFGVIIYIPLYLQTVHGSSPTTSGLQLLPTILGMLLTGILSGRLVTRWGRYKVFPILGTAITAVGFYLLSLMTPTTSTVESSMCMFVVGLGIGMVMQVLVVAVQNAVPYGQLGTATSAATFFRSIGGALGVALLGAFFNSRLFAELPKYLPAAALQHISGHTISSNPSQLAALPPAVHHGYVLAFSHSLESVFLIAVPFALAAFVLTWFLKEVPLREQAYVPGETEAAEPGASA